MTFFLFLQKVVGVLQIVLSTAISLVTTLSMSAICTNGKIGTGKNFFQNLVSQ